MVARLRMEVSSGFASIADRGVVSIPPLPKNAHPEADRYDLWNAFLMYSEKTTLVEFEDLAASVDDVKAAKELKAVRDKYAALTKREINDLECKLFEAEEPELIAKAKRLNKKRKAK